MVQLAIKEDGWAAGIDDDAVGMRCSTIWRILGGPALCDPNPDATADIWCFELGDLGANHALLPVRAD